MNRTSLLYAGTNVAGIFFYVFFVRAIQHQIQMEERGSDFGDCLNFIVTALPVLLFFVAWNGAWGVAASVKAFALHDYRLAIWCTGSVLGWAAIIFIMPHLA